MGIAGEVLGVFPGDGDGNNIVGEGIDIPEGGITGEVEIPRVAVAGVGFTAPVEMAGTVNVHEATDDGHGWMSGEERWKRNGA